MALYIQHNKVTYNLRLRQDKGYLLSLTQGNQSVESLITIIIQIHLFGIRIQKVFGRSCKIKTYVWLNRGIHWGQRTLHANV